MSLVENFEGFLFEGKYDRITGEICAAIMRKVKETNTGQEYFDDIKVIYKDTEEIPGFDDLIEGEKYFLVGEFVDDNAGIDVTVYVTVIRDEFPQYEGGFAVDGKADDQNSIIYSLVSLDPNQEPKCYTGVAADLRNLIRHEIEHLTQRGYGKKESKFIRRNDSIRQRINDNPEIWYKYYKLKDEVFANLHGLYSEAKTRKIPFKDIVNSYLDKKVKQGIIPPIEKDRIYSLWRERAKKIGGLPPL